MNGFMDDIMKMDTDNSHYTSLVELLRYRGMHSPNNTVYIFVSDDGKSRQALSYGELDRLARCVAAHIQNEFPKGGRALLLYPPGLDFIIAFFGCLYAGVVAVPVYPPSDDRTVKRMLSLAEKVEASLIFSTSTHKGSIEFLLTENGLNETYKVVASDVLTDGEGLWEEIFPGGDSLAFIQYTSGSTGNPKGVMVSHGNILHNEMIIQAAFGHTGESVGVGWLPLFHDMGLIGKVIQPLYVGCSSILFSPLAFIRNPLLWLQLISQYRANTSGGPNFAYEHCIKKITEEQKADLDLSCWEVAFNGAEPIRAETLDRFTSAFARCGFRKEAFYPCYGMAESTLIITGGKRLALPKTYRLKDDGKKNSAMDMAQADEIVSCGSTRFDQKIRIVDPREMVPCPDGKVGEIWTSGPSVTQGYWNQPEETEKIFKAHIVGSGEGPFLRTGDLGFIIGGELYVTGRCKDLIIIRGRNYYPHDIERSVENCHQALKAGCGAAFAIELKGEERLVIVQEVARNYLENLDTLGITKTIRRTVAERHGINVHAVVLLKTYSIPKTSSGKIQRHACKDGFLAGDLTVVGEWRENIDAFLEEDESIEKKNDELHFTEVGHGNVDGGSNDFIIEFLKETLAGMTGLEPGDFSANEPINTLGLDSLMVVDLVDKIHSGTGLDIPFREIMLGLTLQGLASAIQYHLKKTHKTWSSRVWVVKPNQPRTPSDVIDSTAAIDNPGQVLASIHILSDDEINALLKEVSV